jgi:hypothetical protein
MDFTNDDLQEMFFNLKEYYHDNLYPFEPLEEKNSSTLVGVRGLEVGIKSCKNHNNQIPTRVMFYNCSGCTTKTNYPYNDLLLEIMAFVIPDFQLDHLDNEVVVINEAVVMLSDCPYNLEFFKILEDVNLNYVFLPTITNEDGKIFGLLTLSRAVLGETLVYRNQLTKCHTTDQKNRSAYYPGLIVKIGGINFLNYYQNAFSGYKKRIQVFQSLCSDLENLGDFVVAGDFNCYGKHINSTKKPFPFWYQLAFLPNLISTLRNGYNLSNNIELAKMNSIFMGFGYDRIYPVGQIRFSIFGINVSWHLDITFTNLEVKGYFYDDGIFDNKGDHPIGKIFLKSYQ